MEENSNLEEQEVPPTVRHYQTIENTLEAAAAAYAKDVYLRECEENENSDPREHFEEAENLLASLDFPKVEPEARKNYNVKIFEQGSDIAFLQLNTKDEFFDNQILYFSSELLLAHDKKNSALVGKEFEVRKIRYCYCLPDFKNETVAQMEIYVQAI